MANGRILTQLSIFALQVMHTKGAQKRLNQQHAQNRLEAARFEYEAQMKFQAMIAAYRIVAQKITDGFPYESNEHAQMDFEFEVTIKLIEMGYQA